MADDLTSKIVDFMRGALAGATTDTLGAPVDVITTALRPLGYKETKPIGGSAHLRELLGQPPEPSSLSEVAGGLAGPAGVMKAALMAIKLTPAELKFFNELTKDIKGNTIRKIEDVPKDYDMPSTAHIEEGKLRLSDRQVGELKDWIYDTVRLKDQGDAKLPPSFYRTDQFAFPPPRRTTVNK